MSEEEKKAYDILLMLKYFTQEKEDKQAIITILELVDKQQKEIKKLEEQKRGLLVETYKNNDEKDKEIERLKDLLVKAGYKKLILNGKEEWETNE